MFVDASDIAIGSVLMQEDCGGGWFWLVYYANMTLSMVENNYSVIERE